MTFLEINNLKIIMTYSVIASLHFTKMDKIQNLLHTCTLVSNIMSCSSFIHYQPIFIEIIII